MLKPTTPALIDRRAALESAIAAHLNAELRKFHEETGIHVLGVCISVSAHYSRVPERICDASFVSDVAVSL